MNMHPKYARLVNRLPEHQKNKIFAFAMPKISRKSIFFVSMLICIVLLVSAGMFLLSPRGVVKGVYTDGYHYQYKDTKSNFDSVSFAKSEKLLPSYRIKEGDVSLAMTYSPTKVKDSYSVISGVWGSRDSLKFKDVEENTNIIYTLEGENTVKEDIELTKRPTKESISSYKFTIELTGLTYERNENGAIIPVFFDKQGTEYSIPPLVMQDANGKESNLVTLTLSAPDPNLPHIITAIVTPNAQWLTDTARKYPVRIDPTVVRGDPPISYWKFDEGTNTTANDSSGHGKVGTFLSVPAWKTEDMCISGKCLAFDNVDDGVSITGENYTSLADYTMCAWVNPKGNHKNYTGTIMSSGDWNNVHWAFGIDQTNTSIQTRLPDGTNFPTWSYTFPLSQWTHVCLTNSGSTITAYANGRQVGSPYTGGSGGLISNATNTTIGRETYAGGYFAFNGSIDEPKIYNYARTALQIKADYNAKGAGSAVGSAVVLGKSTANNDAFSNGLVGYWKMDEASGDAVDSSGNGYTGTVTGTTVTSGKYGNARSFNGSERITTTNAQQLADFTVSVWFKDNGVVTDYERLVDKSYAGGFWLGRNGSSASSWGGGILEANAPYGIFGTFTDGQWNHMVSIRRGTTHELYANGTLVASNTVSASLLDTTAIQIGNGTTNQGATATIDETRIYNRALSPKEVRDLYAWAPGPYTYLSFEEGTGNNIYDTSGNGYSGAWNGTGTHWTNGKYGKAAKFNGSDDYISFSSLPKPSSLPVTIEFWAQPTTSTPVGMFDSAPNTTEVFRNYGGGGVEWWPSEPYITLGLTANQWTHLAFTFSYSSGTQYIEWYKNGIKQTTGSASGDGQWAWTTFRLGNINGGSAGWYSGDLDEFKIYNYARTAKQITEDMQGSQPVVSSSGGAGQGAVGYWKFDEGYGTTANNSGSGGSTINGTLTSMANPATSTSGWKSNGKFGKALNFDGIDDHVSMGTGTNYFPMSTFSICSWVKSPGFASGMSLNGIVSMTYGLSMSLNSSGQIYTYLDNGTDLIVYAAGNNLHDNQWHHVCMTYDGTNRHLFADGVKIGSYASGWLGTTRWPTNGVNVGHENNNPTICKFNGSIDEVKVYNSALTEDEIKLDYSRGSALVLGSKVEDSSDNPVGYWKLDEVSGNTAANTGSGTGTATWSSTGTWVNGRINGAGNVNGQYLVHSTTGLSSTNGTIEAWVKPITGTDDYWGVWQTHDSSSVNWVDWIWLGRYGSTMYFRMGNGSDCCSNDTTFTSTGYFPSDQWTHVAATWKGDADSVADDTMTVYVNGVQMVQRTNVSLQATLDASARIGFGHTYAADGHMDEVKVYNYARSAEQIKADAATDTLNPSLPGAPVAEWKFEEGMGTSANDTSGNGITGTLNSTPSWVPGKIGKGLLFSGSNNVTLGAAKHDTISNATFETWFNYTGGFDDNYVVIQRYKDGSNRQPVFVSFSGGYGNKVVFENIVGGSNRGITSDSTITANTWYHLAVTCGSGGMKMYLNGQVQASTNATTDCFSSIAATTETYIGQNFKGTLDQTKIYNYARTPAQIAYDYNRGKPVAYYRLNECTGSTVHSTNETYNSNLNGTITIGGSGSQTSVGTCTTGSTAWGNGATGKVNSSLNFDGTDDYVLNNSGGFLPTGDTPKSITFWFKPQAGMTSSNGAFGYGCSSEGYGCSSAGVGRYVSAWANTSNIGLHLETCQVSGPSTPSPTTGWHLYTAVFNGNNTISFYIDGVGPTTVTPGCTINTAAGNGLSIGVARWGYYNGQIDELQVYNYALSLEQIKAVYSNGAVSFK